MLDDSFLRRRVRKAMQHGEIPNRFPDKLWGGRSTGGRCVVCSESTVGGAEMELVFVDERRTGQRSYYAHPRCLTIFEQEVQRLFQPSAVAQAANATSGD